MINIKKDGVFYQSKFDYYKSFNKWVLIAASISSMMYFVSDCYLFGKVTLDTIIPRCSILIPLAVFLIVNHYVRNYIVMTGISYVLGHSVMWATIWACYHLPDLSFASDGFLIINLVFLCLGISTPAISVIFCHGLLFVDIAIANTFLDYPSFSMMLMLGIPCYLGIVVFDFAMEKTYLDQFKSRQKIESDLIHDPLTKVYNRKLFDSLTNKKGEFLEYPKKDYCILMFDIDFFKNVNDTYGHEKGDEVLKFVAMTASSLIRADDKVVRWGGEEFVVILSACQVLGAQHKAEVIRKALEESPYNEFKVTVSVGVAPYEGGSYLTAVEHADVAMYCAKNAGRNQVKVYNS